MAGAFYKAELKLFYFIPQPSPNSDLFRRNYTASSLAPATRDPHIELHDCTSDKVVYSGARVPECLQVVSPSVPAGSIVLRQVKSIPRNAQDGVLDHLVGPIAAQSSPEHAVLYLYSTNYFQVLTARPCQVAHRHLI